MTTILLILLLVGLISFSAFLSGSETSLFSLPVYTFRGYQHAKDSRKRLVAKLLKNPRELLVTLMMLNIFSNILVQNVVSGLFGSVSGWVLKVGIPLVVVLFFGEIIPKSISLPNNTYIAYHVAPVISFFAKILGPVRIFLTKITSYISRVMFFFLKKEEPMSNDELQLILQYSQEKGVLQVEEVDLASGYLDLKDSLVREKMRPKEEIYFYDINADLSNLLNIFIEKKCTRVPVCKGGFENVLGILSVNAFFFHRRSILEGCDILQFLKKTFFVPESMNAWVLLHELRKKNESIALVVDEYGLITGLVTQEDLIESVVGEIKDIRDIKSLYSWEGESVIIASGKLELEEFEALFGKKLFSKTNVVTVGGWLIEQLEDIPQAGARYVTDDFLFYVLEADPNRIKRLYIRNIKKIKKKK